MGIRKGKYIGRDIVQEGGASDREEESSNKMATDSGGQRGPWSPDSDQSGRGVWHEETKQEDDVIPDFRQDSDHVQDGIQGYHGSIEQGDAKLVPGMRKTRSRTLAEARQAQTLLSASASAGHSLGPPLDHATIQIGHPRFPGASIDGQSPSNPGSPSPPNSPGSASSSHGASAGLHAALDFIGSQPHGYASPEEVAVLKKLRQRMRPEPNSPSSSHPEWAATGGA